MARSTPLRIVIAYDSYADGLRAWELSERLASRFRGDFPVDRDLWKFDLLHDPSPPVRQASLAVVAQADLVMIAAGGLEHLPRGVQDWIDNWPSRQTGAWAALVASVGAEAQNASACSPMSNYLRQRAVDAGMEFFSNDLGRPVSDFQTQFAAEAVDGGSMRRRAGKKFRPPRAGMVIKGRRVPILREG